MLKDVLTFLFYATSVYVVLWLTYKFGRYRAEEAMADEVARLRQSRWKEGYTIGRERGHKEGYRDGLDRALANRSAETVVDLDDLLLAGAGEISRALAHAGELAAAEGRDIGRQRVEIGPQGAKIGLKLALLGGARFGIARDRVHE